jgi:hypothetical protein
MQQLLDVSAAQLVSCIPAARKCTRRRALLLVRNVDDDDVGLAVTLEADARYSRIKAHPTAIPCAARFEMALDGIWNDPSEMVVLDCSLKNMGLGEWSRKRTGITQE